MEEARTESRYSLPVIGKVKIGEKRTNASGTEYPSSIDYFRFTGKYADDVVKAIGNPKPNKISIFFADDDFRKVCDERFEARDKAGVLVLEGDGETFRAYDPQKGKFVDGIDAKHELVKLYRKDIKHVLTIRFLIVDFKGVLGQWEFTTKGSKTTINRIISPFDSMLNFAKRVRGIPFDLTVEMVKSKTPDGKTKQFPVVSLIPNLSPESVEALGENTVELTKGFALLTNEKIGSRLSEIKSDRTLAAPAGENAVSASESIIPKGEHSEFIPAGTETEDAEYTEEEPAEGTLQGGNPDISEKEPVSEPSEEEQVKDAETNEPTAQGNGIPTPPDLNVADDESEKDVQEGTEVHEEPLHTEQPETNREKSSPSQDTATEFDKFEPISGKIAAEDKKGKARQPVKGQSANNLFE